MSRRETSPLNDSSRARRLRTAGEAILPALKDKIGNIPVTELKDLLWLGFTEALSNQQQKWLKRTMSQADAELVMAIFTNQLSNVLDICLSLFDFKDESEQSEWQTAFEQALTEIPPWAEDAAEPSKQLRDLLSWAESRLIRAREILEDPATPHEVLYIGLKKFAADFQKSQAPGNAEEHERQYKEAHMKIARGIAAMVAAYAPRAAANQREHEIWIKKGHKARELRPEIAKESRQTQEVIDRVRAALESFKKEKK